jgi:hypothetical protein
VEHLSSAPLRGRLMALLKIIRLTRNQGTLQPTIIFLSKARAHLSGTPFKGRLMALSKNIIIHWGNMPGTDTSAYWINS